MKPIAYTLTVLALSGLLGACDSRQEKQREQALDNRADATRDRAETRADALEDRDADRSAEAVRDRAGNQADTLENQADQVRDRKD